MSEYKIVDLNGKLAVLAHSWRDRSRPVELQRYWVFEQESTADGRHSDIIGRSVDFASGQMHGTIYMSSGSYRRIDLTGCPCVDVEIPIPKPRDGKEYTWEWVSHAFKEYGPGWQKKDFPKCESCCKYHDPVFVYCELCGMCHREGAECKPATCWECGEKFLPDGVLGFCPACRQTVYGGEK
jgi:hypothetical protein